MNTAEDIIEVGAQHAAPLRLRFKIRSIILSVILLASLHTRAHAAASDAMWTWLGQNPRVESSIVWQDPRTTAERKLPNWTQAEKDSLSAFYNLISGTGSAGLSETPAVTLIMSGNNVDQEAWDSAVAWQYYLAYVAQSLVVEVEGKVPWSIVGYTDRELAMLFHSRSLFFLNTASDSRPLIRAFASGTYAAPAGLGQVYMDGPFAFTPGDPGRIYAIARDSGLIGATVSATETLVIDWARTHMTHYYGGNDTSNLDNHWHYQAFPPVERVLNGTTSTSYGYGHWTAGCWGTTGILNNVLRTMNIPVLTFQRGGHAIPYFTRDSVYLTHGDDPYNALTRTNPRMPVSWFLASQSMFDTWFDLSIPAATRNANVGIGPYYTAFTRLPVFVIEAYLRDSAASKTHAAGEVAALFTGHYTLTQLESGALWSRMDAALAEFGGSGGVPSADIDTTGINAWYINDASRTGDSFTTQAGSASFGGLTRASPKSSLAAVGPLLTPGDTVYLDAGAYADAVSIVRDSISIVGVDSRTSVFDLADSDILDGMQALILSGKNLLASDLGFINTTNALIGNDIDRSVIRNIRVTNISGAGIIVYSGSDSNLIERIEIATAASGIQILNSNGNTVSGLTALSCAETGLFLNSSSGNRISGSRIFGGGSIGLEVAGASNGNIIHGVTIDSNASWAVSAGPSVTGLEITRSNLSAAVSRPDSILLSLSASSIGALRNWWGAVDTSTVSARATAAGGGAVTVYPWRLGAVDTTLGADSIAPQSPVITGYDSSSLNPVITWNAAVVNEDALPGASGVAKYIVYRASTPGPNAWIKIGETTALSFSDTNATSGIVKYYAVTACDNAAIPNESFYSAAISGRTSRIAGDFLGLGNVTSADLALLRARYRDPSKYDEFYDIGRGGADGAIDAEDFFTLGKNFSP